VGDPVKTLRSVATRDLTMRAISLVIFVLALARPGVAQRYKPPRFEDYPTSGRFEGKPAPVDLRSHPQARKFRTLLRDSVKSGANFAGHYAVNYWGCGTECIRVGIVDLETGRAYIAPFFTSFGTTYRINSRLFLVEPKEKLNEVFGPEVPQAIHTRYYLWSSNRLVLIHPKNERNDKAENYWK
jgi:hypothetical protein